MSAQPIQFQAINDIALGRLDDLLPLFVPGGTRVNGEYVARNPRRSDRRAGSFSISLTKGVWKDFASGDGGSDPVSLWAYLFNTDNTGDAARILAGHLGVPELAGANDNTKRTDNKPQDWTPILPVPADAGQPPDVKWTMDEATGEWVKHPIVARWPYRDAAGNLLGYAARVQLADGSKDVVPQTFCRGQDGSTKWKIKSFPKPRQLYGLDRLAANSEAPVVIFEGEKTADAGQAQLPPAVCITWPGGSNAVDYVCIDQLAGRKVAIWPDNDTPGFVAALRLAERLAHVAKKVVVVRPPEWAGEGWDVADETPDGWSAAAHLKQHSMPAADFAKAVGIDEAKTGNPVMEQKQEPAEADPANDEGSPSKKADEPKPNKAVEPDAEHGMYSPYDFFSVLGYDREEVFIFHHEKKQLLVLNSASLSSNKLIELAPVEGWCSAHPSKLGFDKNAVINEIFRRAHAMPVFNPARIRGRGAWFDDGRHVFHYGDRLQADGSEHRLGKMKSRYIYQAEVPFDVDANVEPLTDDEGENLLFLSTQFRWNMPASAALLAGWVALAPLCGALKWRPHIWLTGGAGCGKSTILERFVNQLTRWCNVYAQGNSTEAGIRQTLGCDAVPVLFDESEQNNDREATRVQNILALIRQASSESGAKTLKGTTTGNAMNFHVRSMFCLASIQVGIQQQADRERLTVLTLKSKPEKGSAEETSALKQWQDVKDALYLIERDRTMPDRLFRRIIGMLPTVLKAIDTFVVAAAKHFGNQRDGDQYGTLMAGCWCLMNSTEPTAGEAEEMLSRFDWNEYTEAQSDDAQRALTTLIESRVRTVHGTEFSVYELADCIAFAHGVTRSGKEEDDRPACALDPKDAQAALQRNGMKVHKGRLMLSNSSEALVRLVAGTPFHADFRGLIARVPGVERKGEVVWINSTACRCLAIPLQMIV